MGEGRFEIGDLPLEALPLTYSGVVEGFVELPSEDPTKDLHLLTGWAVEGGHRLAGLTVTRPSLEDVYLALTTEGDG